MDTFNRYFVSSLVHEANTIVSLHTTMAAFVTVRSINVVLHKLGPTSLSFSCVAWLDHSIGWN